MASRRVLLAQLRMPFFYAAPGRVATMLPCWNTLDATARAQGQKLCATVAAEHERQRGRFREEVTGSRVVILGRGVREASVGDGRAPGVSLPMRGRAPPKHQTAVNTREEP